MTVSSEFAAAFGSLLIGTFTLLNFTHARTEHLSTRTRECLSEIRFRSAEVPENLRDQWVDDTLYQAKIFIKRYKSMALAFVGLFISFLLSMTTFIILTFGYGDVAIGFACIDAVVLVFSLAISTNEFLSAHLTLEKSEKLTEEFAKSIKSHNNIH